MLVTLATGCSRGARYAGDVLREGKHDRLQERATISLPAFHPGQRNIEGSRVSVSFPRRRGRLGDATAATRHFAIYAHGEVAELSSEVVDRLEEEAKQRAIEEGIVVVTTRRADAVRSAGGRIKGTPAVEVVDRRHVQPVGTRSPDGCSDRSPGP